MNRPLYVLPNGGGLGYGLFVLDESTLRYLLDHIEEIPDALTRGSAWVDLCENLLEAKVTPKDFLDLAQRALPKESDEQNTQRVLGYLSRTFWSLAPEQRTARSPSIESLLREGLGRARTTSQKAAWFSAFSSVALTPGGLAWLQRVWSRAEPIEGLPLAEPDEINLALELAVR